MFNLNEKYFYISERCGRNHRNKFCLRPLKGRFYPWELSCSRPFSSVSRINHEACLFFNEKSERLTENERALEALRDQVQSQISKRSKQSRKADAWNEVSVISYLRHILYPAKAGTQT